MINHLRQRRQPVVAASPGIDVDAILATGGVGRVGGYDCTIGTTLLSAMADIATVANANDPDSTWTLLYIGSNTAAGVRGELVSDDAGEHLAIGAVYSGSLDVLGQSGSLTAPATPYLVGISQVDGGAVVARANGGAFIDANLPAVGIATVDVTGTPYVFYGDGTMDAALIYIPSALTAAEIDAIYAATSF